MLLPLAKVEAQSGPRIKVVLISGEFEYSSRETFPAWKAFLERTYPIDCTYLERPAATNVQSIAGLEALDRADLAIIMIRRMVLPADQLNRFKAYLDSGRPLIGLRTASHSFENWREFDKEVLGGNYGNHYGNQFQPVISLVETGASHPILKNVAGFVSKGSLYKNTPLAASSVPLLSGKIETAAAEPVAWTHLYKQSRIFYTSLGHPDDFKENSFRQLLINAIFWTLDKPVPAGG